MYTREDYYAHPEMYRSEFHTKVRSLLFLLPYSLCLIALQVAPYLTLFVNGTGWSHAFPRLMTNAQLAVALERAQTVGRGRFASVGDISCDIEVGIFLIWCPAAGFVWTFKFSFSFGAEREDQSNPHVGYERFVYFTYYYYLIQGGLEFLTRPTTLSDPFYTVRPSNIPAHLPSVQMMAVDILPSSLPLDASKHFSDAILPYLRSLIREYRGEREEGGTGRGYMEALDKATVVRGGELVERHKWLGEPVRTWREGVVGAGAGRKKKVLMLGSGMVAGPAVDQICKRGDVELLVG